VARTDQQRYDQSIAHLKKLNAALGLDADSKASSKATAFGQEISLGGAGYWKSGSDEQHVAVRAYLLCLIIYFRTPHAKFDFATKAALDDVRARCLGKSLEWVNREILYFAKAPAPQLQDLVDAAQRISEVNGSVYFLARTRDDKNVSSNPVCYHGVTTWLFGAGLVSKQWCAKEGMTLDGNNANNYLGDGLIVDPANWDKIPAGYVWNIHKKNDKSTCHWGVSLGNNKAVACNNTDESPGGIKLKYDVGGTSQYGKFPFYNPGERNGICDVLNKNAKYQFAGKDDPSGINIVVRQINPMTEAAYY